MQTISAPVRQCLEDGGHQHTGDGLVEDGVTNTNYVHHRWRAEDREHVRWHALPEVQQEALDLKMPHTYKLDSVLQEIEFELW